jgi:hypothetical protein
VHEAFVVGVLGAVGLAPDSAALVAGILVACDQRCVFSHGSKRMASEYLKKLQSGRINPHPVVSVERQDGATAVIDGDGGLGFFACHRGMSIGIDCARKFGVGAVTTYNHHHFGAAGNWTRMALAEGFVGLAVSTHRFRANPDNAVNRAVGSSPLSIAIPAGEQPPFVLDMGEPVRIADLAHDMVRLSNLEVGRDIEIHYTGLRPGEKLYEELFSEHEKLLDTAHPKIHSAEIKAVGVENTEIVIEQLTTVLHRPADEVRALLHQFVPEYILPKKVEAAEAIATSQILLIHNAMQLIIQHHQKEDCILKFIRAFLC